MDNSKINHAPFAHFADSGILITGNARSGTTLLVSLIDSHPQTMTVPVETKFSTAVLQKCPITYITRERCLAQMVGNVHRNVHHDFDYSKLVEHFLAFCSGSDDPKTLFTAIIYAFHCEFVRLELDSGRIKYWVEKTPAHYKFYEFFKNSFGNIKNVHIVRNPFDLYASWKDRQPGNNLERLFKEVTRSFDHVKKHRENIFVIRYEDLIVNKLCSIANLRTYLSFEDSAALFKPTTLGQQYSGNSSHGHFFSDISTKSLYKFKHHLQIKELISIKDHLQDYINFFGYDFLCSDL